MRKTKKPAIASEWRENKEAQERAQREVDREAARAARARLFTAVSALIKGLVLKVGWVVALTAGVLAAAALLTYSPADPGFSVTGTKLPANLCGLAGAWFADAGFWFFGRSVWWVPAALIVFGLVSLENALVSPQRARFAPVTATCGFILLLFLSSGLETLQLGYLGKGIPMGAGGLVGQYVASNITPWLGVWGTTVILVVLTACAAAMAFCFSWFKLAEALGAAMDDFWTFVQRARPVKKETHEEDEAKPGDVMLTEDAPAPAPEASLESDAGVPDNGELTEEAVIEGKPAKTVKVAAKPAAAKAAGGRIAPDTMLLDAPPAERNGVREDTVKMTSRLIESKLKTYKIQAKVVGARVGPVITQYWLDLAEGVKGSTIESIRKDLTRALAVHSVRVVSAIPGTPYMGLEIPNNKQQRLAVYLKELITSKAFTESTSPLTLALGKDIAGQPVVADLARLPHLLVGGTTGSGKSVAINAMILSLLYKCDPTQLRLVLIDPKTVEFSMYRDIPHLLCPVVIDMNKAANALNWLVQEMDRRYNLMSHLGVRSFLSYNEKVEAAQKEGKPLMDPFQVSPDNPEPHVVLEKLPYIVCFIDELADLILVNRKQIELLIVRLAQKARAAGIHLVLATQRPSVDIVTPLIKANVVARACFAVASRFDSSVVLDENGAQDLLGHGDMLFKQPGTSALVRIQGCMVNEDEVLRVVDALKAQGEPQYIEGVCDAAETGAGGFGEGAGGGSGEKDPLYDAAVKLVLETNRPTSSFIQRRLNIGYNRAANLIETMEQAGIVSQPNAAGKREILVKNREGL